MIVPIFIKKNTSELQRQLSDLGLPSSDGEWTGDYLAVFRQQNTGKLTYVPSPESDLPYCPNYRNGIICDTEDRFMGFVKQAVFEENNNMQ